MPHSCSKSAAKTIDLVSASIATLVFEGMRIKPHYRHASKRSGRETMIVCMSLNVYKYAFDHAQTRQGITSFRDLPTRAPSGRQKLTARSDPIREVIQTLFFRSNLSHKPNVFTQTMLQTRRFYNQKAPFLNLPPALTKMVKRRPMLTMYAKVLALAFCGVSLWM